MNFYVKFLDTRYEKIWKSEALKMVSFGRKSKPLPHLHFSSDLRPVRHVLPIFRTREKRSNFDSPYNLIRYTLKIKWILSSLRLVVAFISVITFRQKRERDTHTKMHNNNTLCTNNKCYQEGNLPAHKHKARYPRENFSKWLCHFKFFGMSDILR